MSHQALSRIGLLFAVSSILMLTACSAPERLKAVPDDATMRAEIAGMPGVRYVLPEGAAAMYPDMQQANEYRLAARAEAGLTGPLPPAHFLALSGGGDDGAFGAGLLCGWTVAGNRPEFDLVTGISTGALLAPFAFLGPKYDQNLRIFYTTISPDDIMEKRGLISGIFKDGLADNSPLRALVEKAITEDMLKEIAVEHGKGRFLLVATTNLDARRPVIWNMTKIAASGAPGSVKLFRDILVASAAIPGAFPPTMFTVEVDGQPHQELHVDGGAFSQVFVYPPSINLKEAAAKVGIEERERILYIIRNAQLMPRWTEVERQTLPIVGRAIDALIQGQGNGDLYRIFATAQKDDLDFNLAYIPGEFYAPHREEFDTEYMKSLFNFAYDMAVKGYPWEKTPPGY
jgi:predicted patatin/cPLA2 family phospholipase